MAIATIIRFPDDAGHLEANAHRRYDSDENLPYLRSCIAALAFDWPQRIQNASATRLE